MTLLEALLHRLTSAAQFNQNYEAKPVCVLWPDKDRLWEPLATSLREQAPGFFQLCEFAPESRTGPALWLKCVLAGLIEDAPIPDDTVPILYLPGVGRGDFRNMESCPPEWQPLMELQYRGVNWSHVNGKDWTVSSVLAANDGGLGLEVAKDARTSVALQQALTKLADVPVRRLQTQQIDSDFLLGLLHPDPAREVLRWLDRGEAFKAGLSPEQWDAFKAVCRGTYQFDPEKDGEIRAAELLGQQAGAWQEAWTRFREAPQRYAGIPEWLRRACPPKQMDLPLSEQPFETISGAWPQVNEDAEHSLRTTLSELVAKPAHEARKTIQVSESMHAPRRTWVWAELGDSPMVTLWEPLAELARFSEKPLAAADLAALGALYDANGWRTDDAVIRLLALPLNEADRGLAGKAVRNLYLPWLEESARNFQHLAKSQAVGFQLTPTSTPPAGTVFMFADALRLDQAHALMKAVAEPGLECALTTRWSAIPSVTPSAKPAVSPIAHLLGGDLAPETLDTTSFYPTVTADNKALSPDRFRKLLQAEGIQFLDPMDTGDPDGIAWTEHGRLDADGHHDGARVALRCREHIELLAERIQALASAGWRNIRVVTDHGWLLLPGSLPQVVLPKFLTNTRWGRCALLTENAHTSIPLWTWSWSPAVRIACPPGVGSFISGLEYAHGGLSLQECRIPELHVRSSTGGQMPMVKFVSIKWVNFRCRITVEGEFSGVTIDVRERPADPSSSVMDSPQRPDANGVISLLLVLDDKVGSSAAAVIVGSDGKVVHKLSLILGEDSP